MSDHRSPRTGKSWRERLGLAPAAPDPDDWVPVLSARVTDPGAHTSRTATRAAQLLTESGVEFEQRPYTLPDDGGYHRLVGTVPSAVDRVRIAVLVRRRDLERAKDLLRPHMGLADDPEPDPISDEELTRLSEEAAPGREPPGDDNDIAGS
jgi:hypothetical protein